jgi:signal transduction histidine kinase
LQDITHIRELDKAKDHFVATVSQDMRAPLDQITELTQVLNETTVQNSEQAGLIKNIGQAADEMMGLVNGLLELAKVNTGMEPISKSCDILEIAAEIINDFQAQALDKRVTLVMIAESGIHSVQGNPAQLRRAISNLIDNAIKYSPENDEVEIIVSGNEESVLIKVCDRGEGIDESDLPYIFDTFYRGGTAKTTRGSGLGLALVNSITEAHHGKIWVESANGDGSVFLLELPVTSKKGLKASSRY